MISMGLRSNTTVTQNQLKDDIHQTGRDQNITFITVKALLENGA